MCHIELFKSHAILALYCHIVYEFADLSGFCGQYNLFRSQGARWMANQQRWVKRRISWRTSALRIRGTRFS